MKYKLEVIGSPIAHSLSPLIHKTFLDYMGIKHEYRLMDIKKGELLEYIDYVRKNSVCGFNVTMPHKKDVMEYLDDIDDEARLYNSVNTVKNNDGRLIGYNTDAEGYKMSLSEIGVTLKGSSITINGAGGAASAISIKAVLEGAKSITVLNKSLSRAKELAENVAKKTGYHIKTEIFSIETAKETCKDTDLFINATPLGMHGIDDDYSDLSFLDVLKDSATVSDLVYNPAKTKILKYAESIGIKNIINGLGMLIYQGLIADKIYFNKDFDFKSLKQIIEEKYYNM